MSDSPVFKIGTLWQIPSTLMSSVWRLEVLLSPPCTAALDSAHPTLKCILSFLSRCLDVIPDQGEIAVDHKQLDDGRVGHDKRGCAGE